jgi:predicted phage terminase large subunit-like protein
MAVRELIPGHDDKLQRATKAIILAESGRLYLPESAAWLADAKAELVRFTGDPKQDAHDDIVDTLSEACKIVTARSVSPGAVPGVIGGTR